MAPDQEIAWLPSEEITRLLSEKLRNLIFTPLELMEKLAALVPQPRVHLTRFFGVLAPHAKIRSLIVPKPAESEKEASAKTDSAQLDGDAPRPARKRYTWAELLARVFAIDVTCPNCDKELKPVAAILEIKAITKILDHLGLPSKPPDIAPARLSAAIEFCEA